MPTASWAVVAIFLAFGLLELVRSDLFHKPGQCRHDGVVEAVSTILLLSVTQPLVIVAVNALGLRCLPQYQGALAGLRWFIALPLFLVLRT